MVIGGQGRGKVGTRMCIRIRHHRLVVLEACILVSVELTLSCCLWDVSCTTFSLLAGAVCIFVDVANCDKCSAQLCRVHSHSLIICPYTKYM